MDTIKKKMLNMKNEKDAALDKAEQLEQSLRDTETAKSEVGLWCFVFICIKYYFVVSKKLFALFIVKWLVAILCSSLEKIYVYNFKFKWPCTA